MKNKLVNHVNILSPTSTASNKRSPCAWSYDPRPPETHDRTVIYRRWLYAIYDGRNNRPSTIQLLAVHRPPTANDTVSAVHVRSANTLSLSNKQTCDQSAALFDHWSSSLAYHLTDISTRARHELCAKHILYRGWSRKKRTKFNAPSFCDNSPYNYGFAQKRPAEISFYQ